MSEYTFEETDIKSLIGAQSYPGYRHQRQDDELSEIVGSDTPICYFCSKQIEPDQSINLHHPLYKSKGGIQVEPSHETCHVEYHSRQEDYRGWGKQSAETRRWALNLKNVRVHPAYDFDRAYYLMFYGR